MRRYSSCLAPSFDAIRRVSGHRHRAMAWRVARLSRRMPSSAGDGFAVSFWSGHDNGCAGITETRQTPQIRATRKRGHEVGRGRKPPSNRPKTPKFGLPRQYHGVEKTDLEKCDKVLPRGLCSMARGRTPPNRQSFRGCPPFLFPCRLRGCKGRFDGACGPFPVCGRIGKTRQIAFVARCRNANGFILKRDRICSRPLSCLVYHRNNGRGHIPPKSAMSMPTHE